jgi:hypothetical protein
MANWEYSIDPALTVTNGGYTRRRFRSGPRHKRRSASF